ncbi:DUF1998 domain-containing protein [Gloeocapsa sp. PCC 73106]|uniref:DUF1998 domain-containing protein n=1 Tax=Gloeocapsa sp. PCC 73106 TaxID=102232 RepID=UPI0002AD00AC|nr:DUF1998 domain-containing protein [Gloeocapsa sp. PCC 73106]ELR96531.1 protein of unknown function (DUF1998) [Gloeocapsa sp. PCC 73106]
MKGKIPNCELRQSQLLGTFGPGAMVDLPNQSVVISGLSFWRGEKQYITENRLRDKVCKKLGVKNIKFYAPPQENNNLDGSFSGVDVFIFPRWFLAQIDKTHKSNGKDYRTRPFLTSNAVKGGAKFDGQKVNVVPVRFVQGCVNGHLSDINWNYFVHGDFKSNCRGQLWLDEAGSGNDFEEIFVRCEACQARRALSQAKLKDSKVLGICQGDRPWLGERGKQRCCKVHSSEDGKIIPTDKPEYNRLLIRSASNAYFSQTLSVISLPDADTELRKVLDRFYNDDLEYEQDISDLEATLRKKPKYADLKRFSLEKVWAEIERRKNDIETPDKSIKQVEIEALLSCSETRTITGIGENDSFDAQARLFTDSNSSWYPFIDRLVLVHRLREVIALVGFTRFEATILDTEGEFDDLAINVRRADLDFEPEWVPAIENKGEGVFISFRKSAIEAWLKRKSVQERGKELQNGYYRWLDSRKIPREKAKFPGIPYIMLHSLSHLLITAVSLECGYAPTAIRERIYAMETGYGILLHTGTSGSEGTLGGLVEIGRKIEQHLTKALELGRLCSNDPVCSQHQPSNEQEERYLHGSACHGCLLIGETSCEHRNEFLDRALVVNTVEELGSQFFG